MILLPPNMTLLFTESSISLKSATFLSDMTGPAYASGVVGSVIFMELASASMFLTNSCCCPSMRMTLEQELINCPLNLNAASNTAFAADFMFAGLYTRIGFIPLISLMNFNSSSA